MLLIKTKPVISNSSAACLLSTLSTNTATTSSHITDVGRVQLSSKRRLDAWTQAQKTKLRAWYSPNVEKITVQYVGKLSQPHVGPLQMTRGISCPIDCAKHLSGLLVEQSVIALVNGQPWDMHRPLIQDCSVDFVHFKDAHNDPVLANVAFWRSASFFLAAILESTFRPEHQVRLINNPDVRPEAGGFVCDVSFTPTTTIGNVDPWIPSPRELRALSAYGQRLAASGLSFEPLDADWTLYDACFADEPLRQREVMRAVTGSNSASFSRDDHVRPPVCLYRLGNFVEACPVGPLISSSRLIGRFAVTSFRPLGWLRTSTSNSVLRPLVYRVQGIALPTVFITHFTTFERLMQWSKLPNTDVSEKPDYVVEF
ncbi:large subunit ribosomal protein L39 [Paragonimus westermani]|uniref:Large subunit ribosomal protein L39 n=1 Tax=Paragonimus westermani TaxID=34504 RepID=A0A5J4N998_9TREM|nr:large subunit ribosomal protein L39 [Paragonimus westermani]